MKKILISIFSALLLGGITLPASAQAQTGPANNEIWYTATAKLAEVTGTGTEHGLHIDVFADADGSPLKMTGHDFDKATGKGVITFDGDIATVGENAFYYCVDLSSVTFSANVTSIGKKAFYYCYNSTNKTGLETVTFAEGSILETIEESAFYYCRLLSSITIPASVTSIGKQAFNQCSKLATVTFAEGSKLGTIGQQAFSGCSALSSITIPASVTSIGQQAFFCCSGLASVLIPNSVTCIENSAFFGCYFTIDNFINNSSLDAKSNNYWGATICDERTDDGLCIIAGVVVKYGGEGTSVTIPNTVTSIGDYAFSGCNNLISVAIPNSVTSIGEYAFRLCI